jgi:hypothetical protein
MKQYEGIPKGEWKPDDDRYQDIFVIHDDKGGKIILEAWFDTISPAVVEDVFELIADAPKLLDQRNRLLERLKEVCEKCLESRDVKLLYDICIDCKSHKLIAEIEGDE